MKYVTVLQFIDYFSSSTSSDKVVDDEPEQTYRAVPEYATEEYNTNYPSAQ